MGLAKILRLKSATGLFLGEHELVCSTMAATPVGFDEVECTRVPLGEDGLQAAVEALVEEHKFPGVVRVGAAARRFFLNTRKLPPIEDPDELADALAGGLARMQGGLVSGTTTPRLPTAGMTTFVACSRQVAKDVLAGLSPGVKQKNLELTGTPLAFYSWARQLTKPVRKKPTEIRVFLGAGEALGVLAYHGQPLAIHLFHSPADAVPRSVELAVLNMAHRARETLGVQGVDVVYVHEGEDGHELASRCEAVTGVSTVAAPRIPFDPAGAASALAVAALRPTKGDVNLFEPVFESAGFFKNFPTAAAISLAGLLAGSWAFFDSAITGLETEAKALRKKAKANYTQVGIKKDDLKKMHNALKEEYKLAKYFFADRAFWTEILEELPEVVPATMVLEDFDARDKVRFPRKQEVDAAVTAKSRQLSLAGIAPVDQGVQTPPELDEIIAAIRASEPIQALLPRITNSNVRLMPGVVQPEARILITSTR